MDGVASPCIAENFGTWVGVKVVAILPPLLLLSGLLAAGLIPTLRERALLRLVAGSTLIGLVLPVAGIPFEWGIWEGGLVVVVLSCLGLGLVLLVTQDAAVIAPIPTARVRSPRATFGLAAATVVVALCLIGAGVFQRRAQAKADALSAAAAASGLAAARAKPNAELMSARPITVVVFSDFQCPYCLKLFAALAPQLALLQRESPGLVESRLAHLPLDMECNTSIARSLHSSACRAAVVATLATSKGIDRYVVERTLFDAQARLGRDLDDIARAWGIDPTASNSPAWREALGRVERDVAWADSLKVNATPTAFVNGYRIPRLTPEAVMAAINLERSRLGK